MWRPRSFAQQSSACAGARYSSGASGHPWRTPAVSGRYGDRWPFTMAAARVPAYSSCVHAMKPSPTPNASRQAKRKARSSVSYAFLKSKKAIAPALSSAWTRAGAS